MYVLDFKLLKLTSYLTTFMKLLSSTVYVSLCVRYDGAGKKLTVDCVVEVGCTDIAGVENANLLIAIAIPTLRMLYRKHVILVSVQDSCSSC